MKLKEVCASTGLSRKTIRLYEEKGLLVPQMEHRNGRDYTPKRMWTPYERLPHCVGRGSPWTKLRECSRIRRPSGRFSHSISSGWKSRKPRWNPY